MYFIHYSGHVVFLCLSVLLVGQVVSKPDGAPTWACEDMAPLHIGSPETTECPFVTKVAKVSRVNVCLLSTCDIFILK